MGEMMTILAFIGGFGPFEMTLILVAMLLLFGRRLPEVGRAMGRGIIEFKKGLKGINDDIDTAVDVEVVRDKQKQKPQQQNLPADDGEAEPAPSQYDPKAEREGAETGGSSGDDADGTAKPRADA
jgi:sec-independent protein translocase protein TatA